MYERLVQDWRHTGLGINAARCGFLLLAAALVYGPGRAGEPAPRHRQPPARHGIGLLLDDARLAPRVSLAMESLTTFESAAQPGTSPEQHVLYNEMTDSVRRRAESMTRDVIKQRLFTAIGLEQSIDNVRQEVRGGSSSKSRRWHYQFGVHSLAPEVAVRYRLGNGSVRLKVTAEGEFGVRFNTRRLEGASIDAWYEGDGRFAIGARLGF